jgi:hypothetical protein
MPFQYPSMDAAQSYFLEYVQNVWKLFRCPAYNVIVAYIYIERYVRRQNELSLPTVCNTMMTLNLYNCHM